ncbi:hypothetical protein CHS0354_041629 [Potamilus streckersoni]|uniref:Uncharacterized protein n=1 Tax=Potamilus streckersoni TaxID=2493646 RepID=A0AAE0SCR8_9BIVA|nr:hypothetical protein CHS0354_041629 [Potamilus streckersoni]
MSGHLPGIILFGSFIDFLLADYDWIPVAGTDAYPKFRPDRHHFFSSRLPSQSQNYHDYKPITYIHNILKNKEIVSTFEDENHKTLEFKIHKDDCNDTFCAYLGYMFFRPGYHTGKFIYSKHSGVSKPIIPTDKDMETRDFRVKRSSEVSNSTRIAGQKFHSVDTESNGEEKGKSTHPPAGQMEDKNHDTKSTIRMVLIAGFGIIWVLIVVFFVLIRKRCRRMNSGRANITDAVI